MGRTARAERPITTFTPHTPMGAEAIAGASARGTRISTLANGMRVASEAMPHLESAAVGVWVRAGSRDEQADQHGIAHLLEHMAFKGTRSRSARAIAEEIENVGGEVNAATSTETTAFYARVLRRDVPLAVDILSDILTNATLDADELERESHVILQEIGAAADTPDDLVYDRFQEQAFADQALGRTILGTPQTVSGFRAADVRRYLEQHYRGPNMVLAAAGAVDHDALVRLAERRFGHFPAATDAAPEPGRYTGGETREVKDLQEAQILLGFPGRAYQERDFYASQFLSMVLGGGMSSRLFQTVREERGLCYAIYAFHWGFADAGLFGVHAATGKEDVETLMPVILDELRRAGESISEAEVERARAQIGAGLLMSMESPAARAGQVARQLLLFGRVVDNAELMERLHAITPARLLDLAGRTFAGKPTLAALGPVDALMPGEAIARHLRG